jgi:serine/threonine protein phosphatase PrpC
VAPEPAPAIEQNQPPTANEQDQEGLPWWQESESEPSTQAPVTSTAETEAMLPAPAAVVETSAEQQAEQHVEPLPELSDEEAGPATGREAETDGTRPLTAADLPALVALRSRRGLAVAAQRDIGRIRSINQDNIFALITSLPRESSDVIVGLFIVADGMGGHDGGEVASRIAVTTVARNVLAELVLPALADNVTEALQPLLIAAVQDANGAIWEHAQAVGSDMGTTCTVALMLGHALYVGHVGDSRAYLATPTGMRLLTNDHSAVGRLIQVGQLDPSEARDHPMRSQLYRTVGQHPEVLVDFSYHPLNDATHLLLCSDGLWGLLDDEILLDVLEHAAWPQDACRELIARANLAGGDDNISAVVVTLPTQ